jgi:hypothetical protein
MEGERSTFALEICFSIILIFSANIPQLRSGTPCLGGVYVIGVELFFFFTKRIL